MQASSLAALIKEYTPQCEVHCVKIFIHKVMENLSSFANLPLVVKHIVNFNEN